ncbi:trimethylamine methyltransferase family protein [Candidatus Contubernalis alkaliaceticus]|uniref:trimethylamine methyltransferase family protein n=1 Tax=Candidatus Contubernalis alkaliaceticus TaxID=338645 RepID=UPI001F4BCFAF|nr:trimethylamine methyltransferase family protein [Candidatus Contubernalis alkalaceticus]UNC92206.1 trimethylamine methyltransferase family protein [Candidatus Contubernalis alkalaceticus]
MNLLHLDVLTHSKVETIHQATLNVLYNTGLKVAGIEALELFADAGAVVEKIGEDNIVKLPPQLVEDCIKWAPRNVVYQGRIPLLDYQGECGKLSFTTFGECIGIIDLKSGQFRKSLKQDCQETALICDYFEDIRVFSHIVNPSDTPSVSQSLQSAQAIFSNTPKHAFIDARSVDSLKFISKMAEACLQLPEHSDIRKIFTATICPLSPLVLNKSYCEIIIESARQGIGILIIPMPMAGATSSVTLGGTLVVSNAEALGSVVLAQLTVKGTPCTYGSAATIMDLTFVDASLGAPEFSLLSGAAASMAKFYELPSYICSGLTDSKLPDAQTGYEFGYSAMLCGLSQADFISGLGVLEQGLTFDYAKLLMDVETTRYISKIRGGIDTFPESIALDVISEIGPAGEYLSHMHTYKNRHCQSKVLNYDRRKRETWARAGGKDLAEKAYEQARNILAKHQPAPLPRGAEEKMTDLISEFERETGLKL